MTVHLRIKYHKYLLLHKVLKGEAPEYLTQKFSYLSKHNPYASRNVLAGNLFIPKAKAEFYKQSFVFSGPTLWNELPHDLKSTENTQLFKYGVKKYLTQSRIYSDV